MIQCLPIPAKAAYKRKKGKKKMRKSVRVCMKDGSERLFTDVIESYVQNKVLLVVVQQNHFTYKLPLADVAQLIEEPNSLQIDGVSKDSVGETK